MNRRAVAYAVAAVSALAVGAVYLWNFLHPTSVGSDVMFRGAAMGSAQQGGGRVE
jgi:hypothetical protein